jgi:low temperature requirement protein LtrA
MRVTLRHPVEHNARVADGADAPVRVSTLELFFDLVFVFTITQLTAVIGGHTNASGLVRAVLMLGLIWWMYGAYAWLTNSVAPDSAPRRLLLLGGMAGFFVQALAIPTAFSGAGLAFGIGYLAVVVVHTGLYLRTSSESSRRAILRIVPFNLGAALLVLIGGIAGGDVQYVLWLGALLLELSTPFLAGGVEGFEISVPHFVERHGLVVLIAIGESVVAVGLGIAGEGHAIDGPLVLVALLGLALSAGLWWTYFGGDEQRAEEALVAAPPQRQPVMVLVGYFYWHLLILLGIVLAASTLHDATAHPFGVLSTSQAVLLATGVALFLAGDALFRHTLAIGASRWRALAAVLALATIPVGASGSATAQLAALVAVLAVCLLLEQRTA